MKPQNLKTLLNNLKTSKPYNLKTSQNNLKKMKNRDTWKFIIQTIAAILTAIATSLGVTSCMSAL